MSTTTAASSERRRTHAPAAHLDASRGIARTDAQQSKDDPREVSLEGAECLAAALALSLLSIQVGAGTRIQAALDDGDLVQRRVEPKYHAASIAEQAAGQSAYATVRREEYLALVGALAKPGVRLAVPKAVAARRDGTH